MSQEQKAQKNEAQDSKPRNRLTGFGVALLLLIVGALLIWYPMYLGVPSGWAGAAISWIFYLAGGVALLFSLLGTIIELQKNPDLRHFLREVLPLGLPGRDAWQNATITVVLFFIVAAIHLIAVTWLDLAGWIALAIKSVLLFLFLLAALFVAATLDEFLIKPFLSSIPRDRESREQKVRQIRKIIVAIGGALVTLGAATAAVYDAFIKS